MARIALAGLSGGTAAARQLSCGLRALILLPVILGCASHPAASPILAEVSRPGVAARVLVPPDLNVNPTETVVRPDAFGRAPAEPAARPRRPTGR